MASPILGAQVNSLAGGFAFDNAVPARTSTNTQPTVQTTAVDNARVVPRDGVELSNESLRASQGEISRQPYETTSRPTPTSESSTTANDRSTAENAPRRDLRRVTFDVSNGNVAAQVVSGTPGQPAHVQRRVPVPGSLGTGTTEARTIETGGEDRVGENIDVTA